MSVKAKWVDRGSLYSYKHHRTWREEKHFSRNPILAAARIISNDMRIPASLSGDKCSGAINPKTVNQVLTWNLQDFWLSFHGPGGKIPFKKHLALRVCCSGNNWFTNHLSALKQGGNWVKLLLSLSANWLWELSSPGSPAAVPDTWHVTSARFSCAISEEQSCSLNRNTQTPSWLLAAQLNSEVHRTLRSSDTTTLPVLGCDDDRWCFTHPSKPVTHLRQAVFCKAQPMPLPNKTPASFPGTSSVRDWNEPSEPAMELYQCLKRKCQ